MGVALLCSMLQRAQTWIWPLTGIVGLLQDGVGFGQLREAGDDLGRAVDDQAGNQRRSALIRAGSHQNRNLGGDGVAESRMNGGRGGRGFEPRDFVSPEIGRASCRERVCQYV